jgi:MarR family transcriptional regulator, organic hydroperoxide resistance regulator
MQEIPITIAEAIVITGVRLKTIANRFVFSPMGITGAKFRILRLLCCDGQKRPSDIMKFAGGTKSNVSQRLNALEKDDLIRRLPPKKGDDRRNVMIEVTPKGKALIEKLIGKFSKSTEALKDKFTPKEIETHFAFIEKLNKVIDDHEKKLARYFDK